MEKNNGCANTHTQHTAPHIHIIRSIICHLARRMHDVRLRTVESGSFFVVCFFLKTLTYPYLKYHYGLLIPGTTLKSSYILESQPIWRVVRLRIRKYENWKLTIARPADWWWADETNLWEKEKRKKHTAQNRQKTKESTAWQSPYCLYSCCSPDFVPNTNKPTSTRGGPQRQSPPPGIICKATYRIILCIQHLPTYL